MILLLHDTISTDYVFDGNSKRLYQENDKPNPINNYGITNIMEKIQLLRC